MDLANRGAVAVLDAFSPVDSMSVFAVDTEPHEVIALTSADNKAILRKKILGIESEEVAFMYNGLAAAAKSLKDAKQRNRHITLFADANDAEQSEGVPGLIKTLRAKNTTISVIALGKPADSDAGFLAEVAASGWWRYLFQPGSK